MALITMKKPDGQTMNIEETSPIKAMLLNQGWAQTYNEQKTNETLNNQTPNKSNLQNTNIATANPNAVANVNYINALYKEAYNRNATQAELDKFAGRTVKDASNIILGQARSPFAGNVSNITQPIQPEITEETPAQDFSAYDNIINSDPFLTEQFQDENIKSQFSKMSPTLQMAYLQMMQSLGKTIEAGKVINPNIEITPEKIQEFTNQATSELDPYYQEQINNYKKDLETSISRLKEDFSKGVRSAEEPFKRNLAAAAESEAQAGLTYGSERAVREKTNIQGQQDLIDENALKVSRLAEDAYKQTERTLGSDVLSGVSMPSLENYNVSKQGFTEAGLRNLYTPQGGLVGSLQKERTTNIKGRTSELEEAYRQQRILNTSQL